MRRASRRRPALAALAFCLAASSWAAGNTLASAQTNEEGLILDAAGHFSELDLISQITATTSSSATIRLRIANRLSTARLRARLHAPVTTRAELLASLSGTPPTPLIAEWTVEDARIVARDDQGVTLSVPIQPPEEDLTSPMNFDDGRPLPLRLEAVDANGTAARELVTFLTPGADTATGDYGRPLTVAVVLDLRLPPSHLADGGVTVDEDSLNRVLDLAEVLIERGEVPLSAAISPETLDALALIGDDTSVAVLRTALRDRQLLATTWTSLDIYNLSRVIRFDVVLAGLRRSVEALRWAGLEASTVMQLEFPPTVRTVRAVTEPGTGVSAFVAYAPPVTIGPFPPVTLLADPGRDSPLLAQADPILGAMLRFPDAELGMQWARAELLRIAAAGVPRAVIVPVSANVEQPLGWTEFSVSRGAPLEGENGPIDTAQFSITERRRPGGFVDAGIDPAMLALLLDTVAGHTALRPATVDDVLAQEPPMGAVTVVADRPSDPGDFGLYIALLFQVEQRLKAYESFLGDDPSLADPLRTLLAASASRHLTTGERTEFLNSVDQQVTQGTMGVEFLARGPITVTERRADLPVTLVNHRPAAVTVALELASDTIAFTQGARSVLTLEPGRNDLSVPVEAAASGRTVIRVTVRTPDEAGAIVLTTGTFSARFTDAEGIGFLILVLAAAVLAAWWLQTLRGRARDADSGGATVASSGPVSDNAQASNETGTPSTGDHTRT